MAPVRGSRKKKNTEKKTEGSADWWDELSMKIAGKMGASDFESVLKISRKTFDYICSLVVEDMNGKPGSFFFTNGQALSISDQVAVALRRLSSGDSLATIGDTFGLNHSTVSQVTWRFVESMEERALHHLQWPTDLELADIKSKFKQIRGFPNCCGVIDSTHIVMCLCAGDPSSKAWVDEEKNHSMILQAIVDPDLRFRDIVAGWPGRMNEECVLRNSRFFKLCEKGKRLNGEKMMLSLSPETELNEYIVGDSGFPLLPWLLTPHIGNDLSDSQFDFNSRHGATRMVAQRALARLKDVWKIIDGVMWRPDKHRLPRIILSCCLLHNILIDLEDDVQDVISLIHHHDPGYRQQVCATAVVPASDMRDMLSLYLTP